jgi:hypothetical protein
MKASAIAVCICVAIVTLAVASLCSTPAHAQQFTFSFQMGGNTYTPEVIVGYTSFSELKTGGA